MSQTRTYADPGGAWSETITTVVPESVSFVEAANQGDVGIGEMIVDDPTGAAGHASDGFLALKDIRIVEDAAPAGNQRLYSGIVWGREYERGEHSTGAARQIRLTLNDLNWELHRRQVRSGARPAETVGARVAWLLASGYLDASDTGYVVYPSAKMDEADYTNQVPADVLSDCAAIVGFNFFVFYDETADAKSLFFDNANTSTAYSTTTKISNNPGDANGTTVLAPLQDSKLERSPDELASTMIVPYARGSTVRTKDSTATTYGVREMVAPSSNRKTLAAAQRYGDELLDQHDTEEDTIPVSVWVSPANVNDIRAGQAMQVKLVHLPGYESYTWMRVTRRTVSQPQNTDFRYQLDLELSPMEIFDCSSTTNIARSNGTVTGEVAVEAGALTWAHATISGWFGGPVDTAVSTIPVNNPDNANDSSVTSYSDCPPAVLRGTGTAAIYWICTLDAEYTICSVRGTNEVGSNSWRSRQPTSIDYWDGSAWVSGAGVVTYGPKLPSPQYWTFNFRVPPTTTKIRLRYVQSGVGGPFGLWAWNSLGTRVYDFVVMGG